MGTGHCHLLVDNYGTAEIWSYWCNQSHNVPIVVLGKGLCWENI